MNQIIGDNLTQIWLDATRATLAHGNYVKPRGRLTYELVAPQLRLTNPRNRVPMLPVRKWSLAYATGELAWYLSAANDLPMIQYYAPSYERFSDDGRTLYGAYGPRIFGHIKYGEGDEQESQWGSCIELLRRDPDTRQAVISIYSFQDAGVKTKDFPCTLTLQFLLRDGKLNLITTMRSNDLWLGTLYDIFCFTVLQELMALQLNVGVGEYVHQPGSLHLYKRNWTATTRVLEGVKTEEIPYDELPLANLRTVDAALLNKWLNDFLKVEDYVRSGSAVAILDELTIYLNNSPMPTDLGETAKHAWAWKKISGSPIVPEATVRMLRWKLSEKLGKLFTRCFF